ncbi:MAG: Proline/betaine transporter [Chlamydiae bacterium]|nr:Proline/betaine transporter [Chlamydiota bacterium]
MISPKKQFWINFSAASIGNIFMHYDKALYLFLAPFLAPLFFESSSPLTALMLTYAIIPLAIFSKPLGALLFGLIGDGRGRRMALYITLVGMALTTALMGFLPTFSQVGWLAPLLLLVGRSTQNFFGSGEMTGGALLILEGCDKRRRTLYNGIYGSSTVFGILLASLGVTWLSMRGSIETDWRWLYWIGGATGVVGLLLRLFTKESPMKPRPKRPILPFLWEHRIPFLIVAITSGFSSANYYMVTSLLNGYLPLVSSITSAEALQANSLILGFDLLLLPLAGLFAMRFPKERLMIILASLIALFAIPLYSALPISTLLPVTLIRMVFVVLGVGFSVLLIPYYQELIPHENRYTIICLGSAVGSQIFGSSACFIGFYIFKQTGWAWAPALYLVATGLLAIASLRVAPAKMLIRRTA